MTPTKEVIDIEARQCIAVNTERIKGLQDGLDSANHKLDNCIPTQIRELDTKNTEAHDKIYDKLDAIAEESRTSFNKIIWYIAISLIATSAVAIIIDKILK